MKEVLIDQESYQRLEDMAEKYELSITEVIGVLSCKDIGPPKRENDIICILTDELKSLKEAIKFYFKSDESLMSFTMNLKTIKSAFHIDHLSNFEINFCLRNLGVEFERNDEGKAIYRRGACPIWLFKDDKWSKSYRKWRGNGRIFEREKFI